VHVTNEQDPVRDRRKAPGQLLRGVRRAVEVPEVFGLVRVQPRFDVGEQAAVDFLVGRRTLKGMAKLMVLPHRSPSR
jgi:hypothetical protein